MHFHETQAFAHQKNAALRPCSTLFSCPNNSCAILEQMKLFVRVRLSSYKTEHEVQCLTATENKLSNNTEVSVHDVLTQTPPQFQIRAIYFNGNKRDSTYLRGLIPLQGMHDDKVHIIPCDDA